MRRPSVSAAVLVAGACCPLFAGGCSALAPAPAPAAIVRGPLPVTTNGAISGTFLQFRPRSPSTTAVGTRDLSITTEYSSLYVNRARGGNEVVIDAELWRTGFALRTGLTPSADVEIEVPLVLAGGGFADRLIEGWHDVFGLPNGGRERRPHDEFEVHVDAGGRRIFDMEEGDLRLGDVPIVLTQRILDESTSGAALALRAGVELPTGSESAGFGNGGIDWGGGLVAERSAGRLTLTGGAYFVSTSRADGFESANVDALDQVAIHGGLEVRWNDAASVLVGLRWSTPVTRDIPLEEIDGDVLELDVGWMQDLADGTRLLLGFSEDLIAKSGPDLTVFAGWSKSF